MKTEAQSQWAKKHQYKEAQFNKLVRDTDKPYQFCLYDYYGNKTNYFSIDAIQFEKIGDILADIPQ